MRDEEKKRIKNDALSEKQKENQNSRQLSFHSTMMFSSKFSLNLKVIGLNYQTPLGFDFPICIKEQNHRI